MPANKQAVIRYNTLDRCFSNFGRKFFIDDLIKACSNALYDFDGSDTGVSRRQIFEDIKLMESTQGWSIPLKKIREGQRVYYRYDDKSFSINNHLLNDDELAQLKEAISTLSKFKGLPQFDWVEELSARIDNELGSKTHSERIIEFEHNTYLKGLEFITPLYHAIQNKMVVKISYKSFKSDKLQQFFLHPYFLKQYNNRWYIFGLNQASSRIINLALDRINGLNDSKITYIPNIKIDFSQYFEDIIGVSVSGEANPIKIKISVANTLMPYIITKPIHGSQKIIAKNSETTIIELLLIYNYELESLILSFGEGMEILEPNLLREKIKKRVEIIYRKYKPNSENKSNTKA